MRVALLNLISTPAAVLPHLGLELRIGLSSEDPMVGRHPSEPFDAYLSVYAPDGAFAERLALGRIPPHRRHWVDVARLVEPFGFRQPHLVVAHRVPVSLAERYGPALDEPVTLPDGLDYGYFRSYLQYGYPDGGGAHGSVIYEIPHAFNEPIPGRRPPVVLTFTTKVVLSDAVTTHLLLLNCSTSPSYATTAEYLYALHAGDGSRVAVGQTLVPPFGAAAVDLGQAIPAAAVAAARDPQDGLSHFCFYGICKNAALAIVLLTVAPERRGVSVEHTHPAQTYLMASTTADQQRVKRDAVAQWSALLAAATEEARA